MNVDPSASPVARWRDPAAWALAADVSAVLIALTLPWSTSLVAIFVVAFIVCATPTIDLTEFVESLKRPIAALPVAMVALAMAGMLWSDAPLGARLYAISPIAKFLVLPLLIYHFERSRRGMWVFIAFLVSSTALMILSWVVLYEPRFALRADGGPGIPVKNYIDQSQAFSLCTAALLYVAALRFKARCYSSAALLTSLAVCFVANLFFVVTSRTALVSLPLLLLALSYRLAGARGALRVTLPVVAAALLAWLFVPQVHTKLSNIVTEYSQYREADQPTSVGLRMEFWRKSLRFVQEAPLLGHGTGSIEGLFERAAGRRQGTASAEVIRNPHNQILGNAIQWGLVGAALLVAMWSVHFGAMWRDDSLVPSIGLLVVTQNIITSSFNSHLFDFNPGWMYVIGVGVAAGVVQSRMSDGPVAQREATGSLSNDTLSTGDRARPFSIVHILHSSSRLRS